MSLKSQTLQESGLIQSQERAAERAWERIKAIQKEMIRKSKHTDLHESPEKQLLQQDEIN
jgi:hypothetical protein